MQQTDYTFLKALIEENETLKRRLDGAGSGRGLIGLTLQTSAFISGFLACAKENGTLLTDCSFSDLSPDYRNKLRRLAADTLGISEEFNSKIEV